MSETIRASVTAVDRGQVEAAYAIGMKGYQAFSRIVLPQALAIAVPVFSNLVIALLKDTSLAFTLGVMEMTGKAETLGALTQHFVEAYISLSLIYLAVSLTLEKLLRIAERRLLRHEQPDPAGQRRFRLQRKRGYRGLISRHRFRQRRGGSMKIDPSFIWTAFTQLLPSIPTTLAITAVSVSCGFIIGLIAALLRIYKVPVLGQIASGYVTFIRGTPMLTHLLLIYFGLPMLLDAVSVGLGWGFKSTSIPMIGFAFISFSITAGAYMSEVIRAGLLAVNRGQLEAAYSIGMTTPQAAADHFPAGIGRKPAEPVQFRHRHAARLHACFCRLRGGNQREGADRGVDQLEVFRSLFGRGRHFLGADALDRTADRGHRETNQYVQSGGVA